MGRSRIQVASHYFSGGSLVAWWILSVDNHADSLFLKASSPMPFKSFAFMMCVFAAGSAYAVEQQDGVKVEISPELSDIVRVAKCEQPPQYGFNIMSCNVANLTPRPLRTIRYKSIDGDGVTLHDSDMDPMDAGETKRQQINLHGPAGGAPAMKVVIYRRQ